MLRADQADGILPADSMVRRHPAARTEAGERHGALAVWLDD